MRISDRYIAKQVLFGTLFAVLVLSLMLMLGNVFRQIRPLLVEGHAPPMLLVRLALNLLPYSLMFTIPWGFLSAVLLVFGRMSADHEITSYRVAGVSMARLVVPVFAVAALMSGVSLWLNVNVVPKARNTLMELVYEQGKNNPRSLMSPGVVQHLGKSNFFVEGSEGDDYVGLHYFEVDPNAPAEASPEVIVHAARFKMVVDDANRELRLKLYDAQFAATRPDGSTEMPFAGSAEPLLIPYRKQEKTKATAMTREEIADFLAAHPEMPLKDQVGYRAVITQRVSFSMACLAFACVAVPLGMQSRRKESSRGLLLSLLIGAGYFLFMILAEGSKSDAAATLSLWAPNGICVVLGWFLFRRVRFR